MRLVAHQKYLVIDLAGESNEIQLGVSLSDDFDAVMAGWRPNTRVSPVWRLANEELDENAPDMFLDGWLFFLSLTNPKNVEIEFLSRVKDEAPSLRLLATLGVFNLLLSVETEEEAIILRGYLENEADFEEWSLADGKCRSASVYRDEPEPAFEKFELTKLTSIDPRLEGKNLELATNILAASSRGSELLPWLDADLEAILASYTTTLEKAGAASGDERAELIDEAYSRVVNANSSISRFTSQALSGTQPIDATESHYWPHSALGIGVANIAARNVAASISKRVQEFDFRQRIEALESKPYELDARPLDLSVDDIEGSVISSVSITPEIKFPPICFFSGRDSFKHDTYSLSLPLETVDLATTPQWSLQTMTHELCHRILDPVLGLLLPGDAKHLFDDDGNSKAYMNYVPVNYLDAGRVAIIDALMAYARCQNEDVIDETWRDTDQYDFLYAFVIQFADVVEEFAVHTLDFLYFYERDVEGYVQSLWLSWSMLPHLDDKLDDYIVRSVVAISADTLRSDDGIEEARRRFIESFDTDAIKRSSPYYSEVVRRINDADHWNNKLKPKVIAGNATAIFVVMFMYAAEAQTIMNRDSALGSGDSYDLRIGDFSANKYQNPLRLLRSFTGAGRGTASDSLWLLYALTFNVELP